MIDAGAVPVFVTLLSSANEDVQEQVRSSTQLISLLLLFFIQAVWALGNIAGDSPECRDYVLDTGVLPPLLK